jgi:hypothetical protein
MNPIVIENTRLAKKRTHSNPIILSVFVSSRYKMTRPQAAYYEQLGIMAFSAFFWIFNNCSKCWLKALIRTTIPGPFGPQPGMKMPTPNVTLTAAKDEKPADRYQRPVSLNAVNLDQQRCRRALYQGTASAVPPRAHPAAQKSRPMGPGVFGGVKTPPFRERQSLYE